MCDASRTDVLDCDLQLEMSARAPHQEAATRGHSVKDDVTHDLFEVLLHDEQKHRLPAFQERFGRQAEWVGEVHVKIESPAITVRRRPKQSVSVVEALCVAACSPTCRPAVLSSR